MFHVQHTVRKCSSCWIGNDLYSSLFRRDCPTFGASVGSGAEVIAAFGAVADEELLFSVAVEPEEGRNQQEDHHGDIGEGNLTIMTKAVVSVICFESDEFSEAVEGIARVR